MRRNLDPNWLALVACYRELCQRDGVAPLTEEELRAFIEDPEFRPDCPVDMEVWVQ